MKNDLVNHKTFLNKTLSKFATLNWIQLQAITKIREL